MSRHLQISKIHKETDDSVLISFDVPKDLHKEFKHYPGQYITLEAIIDGRKYKRPYSLCGQSGQPKNLTILVKRVPGGTVSNYLNDVAKPGLTFKVDTPQGSFNVSPSIFNVKKYVFLAAGCGITPIISMIEGVLKSEPLSKVNLVYSNKNQPGTIFKTRLDELNQQYSKRLNINYIFTAEAETTQNIGRLDGERTKQLILKEVKDYASATYYMCGPIGFMETILDGMEKLDIKKSQIQMEYFSPAVQLDSHSNPSPADSLITTDADVEVLIDKKAYNIKVASNQTILESALAAHLDANYSCRAGVCSSCKAKVISGKVVCSTTGSLSEKEIEQGYVLTCQSRPATENVKVEYAL